MAKLGGSPGAILGIGTGVFLIGLAYTGRIGEVWRAAFGNSGGTSDGGGSGNVDPTPGDGEDYGPSPTNPAASYWLEDSKQRCESGFRKYCTVDSSGKVVSGVAYCAKQGDNGPGNGWAICDGSGGGGGQAFLDLVPTPAGGWAYKNQGGTRWNPALHGSHAH